MYVSSVCQESLKGFQLTAATAAQTDQESFNQGTAGLPRTVGVPSRVWQVRQDKSVYTLPVDVALALIWWHIGQDDDRCANSPCMSNLALVRARSPCCLFKPRGLFATCWACWVQLPCWVDLKPTTPTCYLSGLFCRAVWLEDSCQLRTWCRKLRTRTFIRMLLQWSWNIVKPYLVYIWPILH